MKWLCYVIGHDWWAIGFKVEWGGKYIRKYSCARCSKEKELTVLKVHS